jgi:hypothetical protein
MITEAHLVAALLDELVDWGVAVSLVLALVWACLTLIAFSLGWSQKTVEETEGRTWQYSIRELLLVITSVAVVLGVLQVLVMWIDSM